MKLDEFTEGFITCLFFTTNEEDFPEYCYSGEFNASREDFNRFTFEALRRIVRLCAKFQKENKELLDKTPDPRQNGIDYCYTIGGHGVGFEDRADDGHYSKEIAKALREAAGYSPKYLYKLSEDPNDETGKIGID